MSPTSPPPQRPSGRILPKLDMTAIRARFEDAEGDIANLYRIVRPKPSLQVHDLANSDRMSVAQAGHSLTYDPLLGGYRPQPNLSELTFHNGPGALTLGLSGPHHARYPCNIYAVAADLGAYGSGTVTFSLIVGGITIQTFNLTSLTTGQVILIPSEQVPLVAYETLVQVDLTDAGSGCDDLMVHVELFVPVPSGT